MTPWEKLLELLKDVAPTLAGVAGAAVGGPAVGAVVAAAARKMAGKGDDASLDDVASTILADPDKLLQFRLESRRLEADLTKARLAHDSTDRAQASADMAAVNATMRAESQSEHWAQWGWRPFWGFASGTAFVFVCGLVCYLGYEAVISRDAAALRMIPELVMSFSILFGTPAAILGVASWHRGKMKLAMAGERPGA